MAAKNLSSSYGWGRLPARADDSSDDDPARGLSEVTCGATLLAACTGFEWDEANGPTNWKRHRVTPEEAEDLFFNESLVVRSDTKHSKREKRSYALGQTSAGRGLFVAFTIHGSLLWVISVRDEPKRKGRLCRSRKESLA